MPRKAQSAYLQLLQGNVNNRTKKELHKRLKNEKKLQFGTKNLVPPKWLSEGARKVFKQIVNLYKDTTFLNDADVVTLAQYCDWYDEYLKCNDRLAHDGRTHDGKVSGDMRLKLQISSELDRLARELGLTPAARSSLAINVNDDQEEKSEDDDF